MNSWIGILDVTVRAKAVNSYVVMRFRGNYDFARWTVALQELDARDRDALLDLREISCAMSMSEAYHLAIVGSRLSNLCRHKLALVNTFIGMSAMGFFALCGSSRGLQVGTFEDEASARLWLADSLEIE